MPKTTSKFETFVANIIAPATEATLEGKVYRVVPMVMMVNGVHTGSFGPMLYSEEELAKFPALWNYKPVVVNHPMVNGQPISATEVDVLEKYKIGIILNARYDAEAKALKAEAWIDAEKANAVDARIMKAVLNGEVMELSTGMFMEVLDQPGELDGVKYEGVACNFRADHLAILPDKKGACSCKKGCGLNRHEQKPEVRNCLTVNAASFNTIQNSLQQHLRTLGGEYSYSGYVRDVYDGFFVYEEIPNGDLYRRAYTVNKDGDTALEGIPERVKQVTEYRTLGGAFVGNAESQLKETEMKKTHIDALIANGGYEEADRASLEKFDETKLEKMVKAITPAPVVNQDTTPAPALVTAAPAINAQQPLDPKQFMAAMPPAYQQYMQLAINHMEGVKTDLITKIKAYATKCGVNFNEEVLKAMDPAGLQAFEIYGRANDPSLTMPVPAINTASPFFVGPGGPATVPQQAPTTVKLTEAELAAHIEQPSWLPLNKTA